MSGEIGVGVYNGKKVIVTKDGKTYEKAGLGKSTGAVLVGNMAGGAILTASKKLGAMPFDSALKQMSNLDSDVFKKAIDGAFNASGLAQKGVKIIDATAENSKVVSEELNKSLPKWIEKFPPLKKVFDQKLKVIHKMVIDGENAFFSPRAKIIALNKEKMPFAAFHEMGHALNKNMGGFGKVLAKTRAPFLVLTSLAALTALFKRKKAEGEEPKGAFDKATTFIKNNCGKLAFWGMVPMLMEEGLASIKGAKLAKGLISSEQLKILNKLNGKAWLTYAITAAASGLAVFTVGKVRDAIAHPKEIKAEVNK